MSGGSYEYFCYKAEGFAEDLKCNTPLREAFKVHMGLVGKACHDIEWVDSGDYGQGRDDEAIRACLAKGAEIAAAIGMAREAAQNLEAAIKSAEEEGE